MMVLAIVCCAPVLCENMPARFSRLISSQVDMQCYLVLIEKFTKSILSSEYLVQIAQSMARRGKCLKQHSQRCCPQPAPLSLQQIMKKTAAASRLQIQLFVV